MAPLLQASADLNELLAELYRRAAGAAPRMDVIPIEVIDDPAAARHILARPEVFVKNYDFLEAIGRGRFTSNGPEWRSRAALTQPAYRAASIALGVQPVREIYRRHLEEGDVLDADTLFKRFTRAAVEVFSRAMGTEPIPWPDAIVSPIRETLKLRQWIDWKGCTPAELACVEQHLGRSRAALRQTWSAHAGTLDLLARWSTAGRAIGGFDAAEEMIQNLLASSETTASSLLWALDVLSRQAGRPDDLQARLAGAPQEIERFIDEVLRLFPPVPYLTRRCVAPDTFGRHRWEPGQLTSISIVGLHQHPDHWAQPQRFDPWRREFEAAATRFAYLPFSKGQRACAGSRLAKTELLAALEAFLSLRRCKAAHHGTAFDYGLSSRPGTGIVAERWSGVVREHGPP